MGSGVLESIVSGTLTLVIYAAIIAGVTKLFQICTELIEVKDLLADIKRNTQDYAVTKPPSSQQSPEELARALNAEAYRSVEPVSAQD